MNTLTEREFYVLICLSSGLSPAQIAKQENISIRTVYKHIHRCYDKVIPVEESRTLPRLLFQFHQYSATASNRLEASIE